MPTSSSAATVDKKKAFRLLSQAKSTEKSDAPGRSEDFLTIESALPHKQRQRLYRRSHSTLNAASVSKAQQNSSSRLFSDPVSLQSHVDGSVHISRSQVDKESNPDRISLDRRGLTSFPVIDGEIRLRLLSLQHNLISNLDGVHAQSFPYLVFLDIYDNQLENMNCLSALENLRVLLLGKNRIRRIEGLSALNKVEVLDLHGNQITQVGGLRSLVELKVLNLAGNQIRYVGTTDFQGLVALQELNLRRNRLRKLLGFGETLNLAKLFISNNDLQNVEDISSLARASNLKEISIDNNPVFLSGDCVSFLVSYLPQLNKLNTMQITEQVRKAAMAWRRNKESTNSAFMDLTSDVCLNVRREEVISNARTNWELIRSQTKCLTSKSTNNPNTKLLNNSNKTLINADSDLILTSFVKLQNKNVNKTCYNNTYASITTKVPLNNSTNSRRLMRSNSQETDNSSSNTSTSNEFIRLPPILLPIIRKMEQRQPEFSQNVRLSGSLSSIGPNVDSSVSSLDDHESSSSSASSTCSTTNDPEIESAGDAIIDSKVVDSPEEVVKSCVETSSTVSSVNTNVTAQSSSSIGTGNSNSGQSCGKEENSKSLRNVKSASVNVQRVQAKWQQQGRAVTAKVKKQASPQSQAVNKDREQGGDYLIEICGRYLNVYGQCALRFIDRPWNSSKANDVNSVKFNYVNFNGIAGIFNKLKQRFPNVENFYFKETNIQCLGQLNALAEVQGLQSLSIDPEGNPIILKSWRSYAVYRLSHWGLAVVNEEAVTEEEIKRANEEYQSLSDLVLWSLPDALLQPLLARLRLDVSYGVSERNAKKWLLKADPDLKSVVSKEALQWKKGCTTQEDLALRQKAKHHISQLLEELGNSVNKLRLLDKKWPGILHEFVRNALLDYSQIDMYMKQKILELK